MFKLFGNLKISLKLFLAFMFVSIITLLVGYQGIVGVKKGDAITSAMYSRSVVPLDQLNRLSIVFGKIRMAEFAHLGSDDPDEMDQIKSIIDNTEKTSRTLLTKIKGQSLNSKQLELLKNLETHFNA